MKILAALAAALTLLAVSGCGGDEKKEPGSRGSGPLLEYQVENGFAHTSRTLVVGADGAARLEIDGRTARFQLGESDLQELTAAVKDAGFAGLAARYEPEQEVFDTSIITVTAEGREVKVKLPARTPAGLEKVIALARAQIEAHAGSARLPGPSDNLFAFSHTGGIAGIQDKLFVRPDGAARIETREGARVVQLKPAELDELRRAIDAAGFAGLDRSYGPNAVVADGFIDKVTADGRTVTVETGGKPPAALDDLIDLALGLIDTYR